MNDPVATRHPKCVSVVVPVFNEQDVLPKLIERLQAVADAAAGHRWQFVLVDDGSSDGTLPLLREAAGRDDRIHVISLSRNFGHQVAISAGLDFSEGDAVAIIDGDLQDPPEMIPEMLKLWADGADVVYAVKRSRQESLAKRTAYKLFYRLLRRASNIEIPIDSGDCSVMDRKVVDVLGSLPDRSRFVRGLRAWVGFHQVPYYYDRDSRQAGEPKYTIRRLVLLALDGMVSFSEAPLRVGIWIGGMLIAASLAYALFASVWAIVTWETRAPGFATVLFVLSFLSGVQLLIMSLLGEYVLRIFSESKGRPLYVVKARFNRSEASRDNILGLDASPLPRDPGQP
ncbi:MAG: glycosyltransferase family 2 protein [bacterium]|nr:glycosyltransferase family 2 protein [bacterium]MCP5068902.1 glycosyltransferase family 2 protein [bacterium]